MRTIRRTNTFTLNFALLFWVAAFLILTLHYDIVWWASALIVLLANFNLKFTFSR